MLVMEDVLLDVRDVVPVVGLVVVAETISLPNSEPQVFEL